MEDNQIQQSQLNNQLKPSQSFIRRWLPTIVGAAIVAFGIGGFFLFQVLTKSSEETKTPTQEIGFETAAWKTYRNEDLGFSINYPDWYSFETDQGRVAFQDSKDSSNMRIYFEILDENISESIKGPVAPKEVLIGGDKKAQYFFLGDHNEGLNYYYLPVSSSQTLSILATITEYGSLSYDKQSVLSKRILSTFRFVEDSILPTSCKDEPESTPVITSVSSYSGPVGTKLEIRGCNFSGFEGDNNAWIENTQGVRGILYGEAGSTHKLLRVILKSPLCQSDTSYSGLPCSAWLTLIPGEYKIYALPLGKKSNEANFSITAGDALSLKVYFSNSKVKPINLCNETLAVARIIPKTEKIATAILNELLKGPTSEERIAGYVSNIPTGSKLNSLAIISGEAQADFNEITESGGGSCSMAMRTAQIRETLLQFATVKTVNLSINGRAEDIFQP